VHVLCQPLDRERFTPQHFVGDGEDRWSHRFRL
jgi:hypothetical protein